jgi:hypothetical protein
VTLEKAGDQIKRKANVFASQTDRFWADTARKTAPDQTQIIPFVLTNLCVGVGLDAAGVPVTDIYVLERFLSEGGVDQFVTLDPETKDFTVGQKLEFYQTAQDAEKVLKEYLTDPPQLRHFRAGLKQVSNIIPSFDEKDVPWFVVDYDVQLDRNTMDRFRLPNKIDPSELP